MPPTRRWFVALAFPLAAACGTGQSTVSTAEPPPPPPPPASVGAFPSPWAGSAALAYATTTTTTSPPPTTTTTAPRPAVISPEIAAALEEPDPPPPPVGSVQEIIAAAFGSRAGQAIRVAACESGLNPHPPQEGYYHGLFQIGEHHAERFEQVTGVPYWGATIDGVWNSGVWDPWANATYAAAVVAADGGWSQWECKP